MNREEFRVGAFTAELAGTFLVLDATASLANKANQAINPDNKTLGYGRLDVQSKGIIAAGLLINAAGNSFIRRRPYTGNLVRLIGTGVTYSGIAISCLPLVEKIAALNPSNKQK
ncbi:MAG: hypothetical protein M3Q79_00395 [bacterium]|nr:hypothetical protein [bacterium]